MHLHYGEEQGQRAATRGLHFDAAFSSFTCSVHISASIGCIHFCTAVVKLACSNVTDASKGKNYTHLPKCGHKSEKVFFEMRLFAKTTLTRTDHHRGARGNAPSLLSMSAQRGVLHGRHSRRVAPECLDSSPDRLGRAGSVASDSPLLQDDANGGADFAAALQERFLHESEFPGNVADDPLTVTECWRRAHLQSGVAQGSSAWAQLSSRPQ